MKATLKADVELWEVHMFAELAVWEPRPDLQQLCTAARGGGELGVAAIDGLLPGLSETACRNILRTLVRQRLLGENHLLTPLGRRCATTGKAPEWEMGVYSFLVARHPVVDSLILGFLRTDVDPRDRDFDSLEPLPTWLAPDREHVWQSVLAGGEQFSVRSHQALRGRDTYCRLHQLDSGRLVWNIDLGTGHNSWRIEGPLGSGKVFRSAPGSWPEAPLTRLMERWEPRWNCAAGRALIDYADAFREGGHDDFLRTFTYPRVEVPNAGDFQRVVVEDVPVGPASEADARAWAAALATARVADADAYVTTPTWTRLWQDVIRGSPIETGAGPAPAATSLVEVAGKPLAPRSRWLLCAAVDLATGGS